MSLTTRSFLTLPQDIIIELLKFLDHVDILNCMKVCRKLRSIINNSVAVLYQMELGVEGYIDGPRVKLCTSDRLQLLRERRTRWLRLDWKHASLLDASNIIPVTPLPYEMQGGTFFNVINVDGVININQTRLPSAANPEPLYERRARDKQFVDITTDPSQDLMISLDVHGSIHVWSLTSLETHPLAKEPVIRSEGTAEVYMTGLCIAHDLFALVEWSQTVTVSLWNWKTGTLVLYGSGDSLPYLATGLVWLSKTVFVIADATQNEFVIFSLAHVDCEAPRKSPLSFADLLPCARLRTPLVHPAWHVSFFQLEATPLLVGAAPGEPFAPAPADHILVFTLQYATENHASQSARHHGFVHARVLLAYAAAPPPRDMESVKVVPWTAWGQRNTRFTDKLEARARYAR